MIIIDIATLYIPSTLSLQQRSYNELLHCRITCRKYHEISYFQSVIEEDAVSSLAHQYANGHNHHEEKDDLKSPRGKTLEIIAQKAGVSTRTAEQYDAIQRKGID